MVFVFLLLWMVIGAIVGFAASKIVNLRGDAPIGGIGVSTLAAGVSGMAWNMFSGYGVANWTRWSCLAAGVGAAIAVTIWHLVRARYVSRAPTTVRRSY